MRERQPKVTVFSFSEREDSDYYELALSNIYDRVCFIDVVFYFMRGMFENHMLSVRFRRAASFLFSSEPREVIFLFLPL